MWLPTDPLSATEPAASTCSLRPLPAGNRQGEAISSFADPEEYRLMPGSAVLDVDADNVTSALRLYRKAGMTAHPSFTIWEKKVQGAQR